MQEEFRNEEEIEVEEFKEYPVSDVEAQKITLVPPAEAKNKTGKGLKAFCLALAATILLSCFTFGGYYLGKNDVLSSKPSTPKVETNLEKKPESESSLTTTKIYDKVAPSVVGILVYNDKGDISEASGVVYSKDGYIVTNDHIYSSVSSAKFKIYSSDGKVFDATYVAGDTRSDLSVLKISGNAELTPGEFGDSGEVISGEKVCAIGYPNGHSDLSTITTGIVSTPRVRANISSSYSSNFIQTDTAINPGNSGGALVNEYGQIIGIVSSKIAGTEYEGVGYAIPSRTVKKITESLISNGNVKDRAKLGISYVFYNSVMAELSNLASEGLLVKEVSSDSDLFNKLKEGDIITRVNDIEISDDAIILDLLEECKPEETILLTVIKESGETVTLSVELLGDEGSSSYVNEASSNDKNEHNKDFNFPEGY